MTGAPLFRPCCVMSVCVYVFVSEGKAMVEYGFTLWTFWGRNLLVVIHHTYLF